MGKLQSYESMRFIFKVDETRPEEFFKSIYNFFYGLKNLQSETVAKSNTFSKVDLYIHEINIGSLIAKFIKMITIDDNEEGCLDFSEKENNILEYSNSVQDIVLEECANRGNNIIEAKDIMEISNKIKKVSDDTEVSSLPNFKQPSVIEIAKSIENFQKATTCVPNNESLFFSRDNLTIEVPKFNCKVDYDLLTTLTQKSTNEIDKRLSLKIKTAIFLGKTKWKFLLDNGKSIDATILDDDWTQKFYARKVSIYPGDCFDADIKIKEYLDDSGNILSSEYFILSIKGISEEKDA